jgi:hypothetical protein
VAHVVDRGDARAAPPYRRDVDDRSEDPADEDPGGRSPGWVSWLLVLVAVLPPVVLAEVSRRFLVGSADGAYFGTYVSADEVRARLDVTPSVRFRLFWATVPVPDVLLASLPVVLALCAVVVAGRPDWLVPPRWGRRVAAVAATLTVGESLVCLVMLLHLADAPRSDEYGNLQLSYLLPSTGEFPEVAPVLALLVVTAVVPAVGALVLWRAGDPEPVVVAEAVPAGPVPAGPEVAGPERGAEPPAPFPHVPEPTPEELRAYRRPGS